MEDIAEEYNLLREAVRNFVNKEIFPKQKDIEIRGELPEDIFRKMGSLGFLGITIPEEYGGVGMGYLGQGIVEEELAYASPSIALSYGAHSNLCLDNLYRNSNKKQKEEYVPKLVKGEMVGSLCLTEPSSGSDALAMSTEAIRMEDYYLLNGTKTLITNAPISDVFLVYAKTGDQYSAFIVLGTDEGLSRSEKFEKLGMRGSPTGEVFFDSIRLNSDRLLGEEGSAKKIILGGLNTERATFTFMLLGIARRALDLSLSYVTERKQFGKFLYEFELIQDKLANMYTRYEASRLLAYETIRKVEKDCLDGLLAASSIYFAGVSAEYISREALQIYGGYGYIQEYESESIFRNSILGQIGAGTSEIREIVISRELIKRYLKHGKFQL
ncbi:MAG: acyl-CoA dehydrogenase family protein [Candidatus Thermoplasmatota archaeon]|jgi:isovaleryl-CoA dehydrogenase|nr:acyl-CoA dehydrogenase family protein [Candidatus Thermoplasmatota archaeon]MCL5963130.1 acyl-CoA dehydrogenase family protein [Candidatus Thermoplasmatota archaeon]